MAITYDGTNILNNIQITRFVQHESVADYDIDSFNASKLDGTIYIDEFLREKQIVIEGVINGTTQSNLEANIDTFNELMNRKNKNLDISYAGGTRRYVCIPQSTTYNRDHYHLNFVPFKVVMTVPLGVGVKTSATVLTAKTLTSVITTETLIFAGSATPKPVIKLTVNTRGNADVIRIENTNNDDYIDVDLDGFSSTDYVEVNCEDLTVLKNGTTEINYRGRFPRFKIGNNAVKYTVFGSSYDTDQEQVLSTGGNRSVIFNNAGTGNFPSQAQSFIPSKSGRIGKVEVNLSKSGSPTGQVDLVFFEDNNNYPSTKRVDSHNSIQIDATDLSSSGTWEELLCATTRPFLVAGQKYWLVLNPNVLSGTDASNFIGWHYANVPTAYLNGKSMAKADGSSTYYDGVPNATLSDAIDNGQFDSMFRIYVGDGDAPDFNLSIQFKYTKKYL
jgi:hypothetical protein